MDLLKRIYARILSELEARQDRRQGHPPRVTIGPKTGRRALLMYCSAPLRWAENDPRFGWHENLRQSRQIAEILVECGYQTDVVDYRDDSYVPKEQYNIFIGHAINATKIALSLNAECRKVCLATGQYGQVANRQTLQRYLELENRRGCHFAPKPISKMGADHYKAFDEIACFGNQHTVDTFASLKMSVHPFPNYFNPRIQVARNTGNNSCHFVYIAAGFHVLKGLDLLMEVFSANPEWHLHVCGRISDDLRSEFEKELSCENIHQYGYVTMDGKAFRRICNKSRFYISPSCSESMQGATLNAMAMGLIPVISTDVDVNVYGGGFRITDCSPSGLIQMIERCISMNEETLSSMRALAQKIVAQHYCPDNFTQAWLEIIKAR